jgi:hypothetical protein
MLLVWPFLAKKRNPRAGIVAQVVELLPSKCEFKPQYHQKKIEGTQVCYSLIQSTTI